jgi:hypothetical protein
VASRPQEASCPIEALSTLLPPPFLTHLLPMSLPSLCCPPHRPVQARCSAKKVTLGDLPRHGWAVSLGHKILIFPALWSAARALKPGVGRRRKARRVRRCLESPVLAVPPGSPHLSGTCCLIFNNNHQCCSFSFLCLSAKCHQLINPSQIILKTSRYYSTDEEIAHEREGPCSGSQSTER